MEALASWEDGMEEVEKDVELFRLRKVAPLYERRNVLIKDIPGFWSIVLNQHSDFANYVRASDFKYIDAIKAIEIKWLCLDDSTVNPRNFELTVEFNGIDGDFEKQIVTKVFEIEHDVSKIRYREKRTEEDDALDEELGYLTSKPVDIKWPKSYDEINPDLITDKRSSVGKRNYRSGMKSFFGWFRWTGLKPGKEFPNGDGLANLFIEELYPYCIKYYTDAQRDVADESESDEEASDEPIQLDLSDKEESEDEDGVLRSEKRRKL